MSPTPGELTGETTKVRALTGAWGSQAEHRARVMAAMAAGPAWS
jgi:hypothetical protein